MPAKEQITMHSISMIVRNGFENIFFNVCLKMTPISFSPVIFLFHQAVKLPFFSPFLGKATANAAVFSFFAALFCLFMKRVLLSYS
jgi:hypothetical protein